MRLAAELERRLAAERSPARAEALREDLARLRRLCELAASSRDRAAYVTAARRLGWTPGDARTHELAHVLMPLLEAVHDYEHGEEGELVEARMVQAWDALARERLAAQPARPAWRPRDEAA